jgi:hypothetical protein
VVCTVVFYPPIGTSWVSSFLKHYSQLGTTLSKIIEASRITAITKSAMRTFFNEYQSVLTEGEILPSNSYNIDETDIFQASELIIGFVIGDTQRFYVSIVNRSGRYRDLPCAHVNRGFVWPMSSGLRAHSETKTVPVPVSDMACPTRPGLDFPLRTMDPGLDRPNFRIARSARCNGNHIARDSIRWVPVTNVTNEPSRCRDGHVSGRSFEH